ncbi:MAG: UDP-2,3-diacylglucosamine diphosphatase [Gammaproteobacteria bacterium]|nr:UDP-2,3-diacylglucosamine diphosphatase [Gammaproteobacteria bacterium]MDP6535580.1 UDP-2,3-diacylglucosamine diphosphatase [Gammaproteobacteria bacterium]MDP6731801.1 UDP-2,3-diacylglucosamine diphosphatase [Gammaproteobacteria bacterium]
MPERILFISDLHLEESRPDITATLLQFLDSNRGRCSALYILGDLFDVWIGDDERSELITEISAALRAFAETGPSIYILHGNRDFLIGEAFASSCGAQLIFEPFLLDTEAGTVVLLHGDSLCTDDVDYMQFRETVRQGSWQQEFLAKPLKERRAFAEQARQQSQQATAQKDTAIMDVNAEAVLQLCRESRQFILIHGHTHRPALHNLQFDDPVNGSDGGTRMVLGDWDTQGWYGEIGGTQIQLHRLAFSK